MATYYNILSQIQGRNGFGLEQSDAVLSATLAAGNTALTVNPSNAPGFSSSNLFLAVFSYGVDEEVWVNINTAAAPPAGAAFAAGSELNPPARLVKFGDVINFNSVAGNASVSVSLYSIQ